MLHHRIATYAIILFLVLVTFILISISKQVENEQALILDSQASNRTQSQTNSRQRSCPANGMPARITYDGEESRGSSSCYFGQFRYASVRCNEGDRPLIIYATSIGNGSRCADKADFIAKAKERCGCNIPTPTPTSYVFTTRTPISGYPDPGQGTPAVLPSPTRGPNVRISPTCKTGMISHELKNICDDGNYRSITFTCLDGFTKTLSGICKDPEKLYTDADQICKSKPLCSRPTVTPAFPPAE